MKVAYFAPQLPALSATFIYREMWMLAELGAKVIPFSMYQPTQYANDKYAQWVRRYVTMISMVSWLVILSCHGYFMMRRPKAYYSVLKQLIGDLYAIGWGRQQAGLVYRFIYSAVLARRLLQYRCDHLHVHFAHTATDIAMYASTLSGVGYSVTAHANDLFERGWLLAKKVERARFFNTISDYNRQFLLTQQANGDKLTVIRCGVDIEQFHPRRWKRLSHPIMVGVVARLVEKKGLHTLLTAMSQLTAQYAIRLQIIGTGPEKARLQTRITALGLEKQVTLMGAQPHSIIAQFIQTLDMFVLPCEIAANGDRDGIPVVLMEAMLSGIPVISTQIAGIPELVIDNETGYCVKPQSAKALATAIEGVIHRRQHSQKMARKAIQRVKTHYALQHNTRQLYRRFLAYGDS